MTMRVDMERVDDVMNYPEDIVHIRSDRLSGIEDTGKLSGNLEIRSLNFGYSPVAEPFIKDFSMSVRPGGSVAFVGTSGCGKSTLAKLIAGLYQPWSGEILFDGKKLTEIDAYTFKSSVSIVDQDITLFEDTIAENIRLWDRSIEDFSVILAARDAGIHDTIVTRNKGYESIIKEGGKNFSGGERQRFEIARVLSSEPTIIILDEATSALDAQTEESVMKSIRNTGATCVIVAHRLSTVRDCDEIIVLDAGKIIERGTHDQLIQSGGKYASLVASE
jgi:ABC-type bacteriocin/lantibiotic exporter with double-glycine peptidase domain